MPSIKQRMVRRPYPSTSIPLDRSLWFFVKWPHRPPPVVSAQRLNQNLFSGSEELGAEVPIQTLNGIQMTVWKAGIYEVTTGTGKILKEEVPALPPPIELSGSWQLTFPPRLGAPKSAIFDHLISWNESSDPGIKYFSGTATYNKDFTLPDEIPVKDRHLYLDLGNVKNLAEVSLNGKNLGVLWKKPFRVDITEAAKSGVNHLAIKVTNLWPNRLIGDQHLPEAQRITWASVSLYTADSPLLPSGLIGPVTIIPAQKISFAER